jgi:hypothetical protein
MGRWIAIGLLCATATGTVLAARGERLALRRVALDLPGPPSKVIPRDLDGDNRLDLVVVVAYTEIEQISEERVEDLVQITTVIPAAFDRREVWAYLGTDDGGYEPAGAPAEMPTSVLHLEPGPEGLGIVALTDDGLSRLRYDPNADGPVLTFEPVIEDPPILARTRSFYTSLSLVDDLDGDGIEDLLLPSRDGLTVYRGTPTGVDAEPSDRIELPSRSPSVGRALQIRYPRPEVRDVNGDGVGDLLFAAGLGPGGSDHVEIMLGSREGVFRPLREETGDCHDRRTDVRIAVDEPDAYPWPRDLVTIRDLDGDGRAEVVFGVERSRGDSMRKEMKDAKRPIQDYAFHRLSEDLDIVPDPYFGMKIVGHTLDAGDVEEADFPFWIQQFQDLDGDGREDLVTLTLDFSIFQVVRILVTKRISVGVDFHVYCQNDEGRFREVSGLDLSEKLKFDLNNLKLGRFAQFAGDFDGDGRHDFVHLGRGKSVTIHTGQPGCRYPKKPDLSVVLEEEPASLDLVRIEDLDGDGRSDIRVTRPLSADDPDETAPVRLDLYLSGSAP